jgi:hypothetical protein
MSLLNPEIQKILKQAGLGSEEKDETLQSKLNRHNLSLDDALEKLADLANNGETDQIKMRAVETTLKINGVLKETGISPPSITINIIDNDRPAGPNPILIPREFRKCEEVS